MSESDSSAAVLRGRPKSLAALMETGAEHARLWGADELAAIFQHQMSAPVLVDLGGFDPGTAVRLKTLSEAQGLLLKSFSDLFHHPSPPIELLRLTKEFAKANMDRPESGLPTEIVSVLYYTSIAAALVRLDARISQLKDTDLRRGLLWAKEQAWIDEETKALLLTALEKTPQEND
ncbi:MAG TPA: hypothetical protein VL171_15555 [Verrucomicrobiae bacterium]|nr:hypothetical protein [Verrucomicrobiae bacterium]